MDAEASRGTVLFSNVAHSFTHLALMLYPTVVLALESVFSLDYGALMALSVPGFVLVGAGALPAGWLGDRWSVTGMMAVFFFGLGGACIATGLAQTPFMLAVGLGLIGLFAAIYHPVGIALIVRSARNRGRALGVNGVFGGMGMAAAGFVAGGLTEGLGWRWAFILPGIAIVATGVAFLAFLRRARVEIAERPAMAPRPEAPVGRSEAMRGMIVLAVAIVGTGLLDNATAVALPKIFAERTAGWLGGGVLDAGLLFTVVYAVGASMQLVGGWVADRFPHRLVYILCYLMQVPLLLAAAQLGGPALVLAMVVFVSMNTGMQPTENLLLMRYSPARWRATAYGAKFVLAFGASSLAVPMVALIHESTGGFTWFYIGLAAIAATVLVAALCLPGGRSVAAAVPMPEQAAGTR